MCDYRVFFFRIILVIISVRSGVSGTQICGCLFLKPLFFIFILCFSLFSGELHFIQDVGDELVHVLVFR